MLFEHGRKEDGISQIHEGMAELRTARVEWWRTYHLALLAEVYGKNGQADKGLDTLDEALAMADATEQRQYEAELNRLKGQFLLIQGESESKVESYYRRAIDVASRQSARSMELRASVSLSRLLQKQGKKEEARKLLSGIYNWFTEGFNTADPKEAKTFLDEMT